MKETESGDAPIQKTELEEGIENFHKVLRKYLRENGTFLSGKLGDYAVDVSHFKNMTSKGDNLLLFAIASDLLPLGSAETRRIPKETLIHVGFAKVNIQEEAYLVIGHDNAELRDKNKTKIKSASLIDLSFYFGSFISATEFPPISPQFQEPFMLGDDYC